MSPTQKKRFAIISLILAGAGLTAFFATKALQSNLEYFLTPQEVQASDIAANQRYRIAGLVKKDSLTTETDGVTRKFVITDCEYDVTVRYKGLLPDLFREGQAIVAKGRFDSNRTMQADQVLAKHDENYVPNEAAETMMLAQANKCDNSEGPVSY